MCIEYLIRRSYYDFVSCSLRLLLHKRTSSEHNKPTPSSQTLEREELSLSQDFVKKLLTESLTKLHKEEVEGDTFTRWELGACWIQHLQDQNKTEKEKKQSSETKNEMKVEGLGTPLRSLKNRKKNSENLQPLADVVNGEAETALSPAESHFGASEDENEIALRKLLTDAAFSRLKDSKTGLHCKVVFGNIWEFFLHCLYSITRITYCFFYL